MLQFWLDTCGLLERRKAEFYSGARKILRNVHITYKMDKRYASLQLEHCGFTKSKMSMLRRNYYVEESINAAITLWNRRREQGKYGSVGFSCYGHYVKGGGLRNPWELSQARKSGKPYRASVMGPCIQSVTLTMLKKSTAVDVFYRTTEIYKKWPADLVFIRDVLLPNFDFTDYPISEINFHFANVTVHPMYAITTLGHTNWGERLDRLRGYDKFFYDWVVKWTARYICDEATYSRGIAKFSQALRVKDHARKMFKGLELKKFQSYLKRNHPGHRNAYEEDDDE